MKIVNLTTRASTYEQEKQGVFDLYGWDKVLVQYLHMFKSIPSAVELADHALGLAYIAKAKGADAAMIDGAPFFMSYLEAGLTDLGIKVLYPFYSEVYGEIIHTGFIEA